MSTKDFGAWRVGYVDFSHNGARYKVVQSTWLGRSALVLINLQHTPVYANGELSEAPGVYVTWDGAKSWHKFELYPSHLGLPELELDYCTYLQHGAIYLLGLSPATYIKDTSTGTMVYNESRPIELGQVIYRLVEPGMCPPILVGPHVVVRVLEYGNYTYNRTFEDPNGVMDTLTGSPRVNGTVVQLSCVPGLEPKTKVIKCLEGNKAKYVQEGQDLPNTTYTDYFDQSTIPQGSPLQLPHYWSYPPEELDCEPLSCVHLTSPENGNFHILEEPFGRFVYGTVAHFYCDRGYQLLGDEETRCGHNGEWSHPIPRCINMCEHFGRLLCPDSFCVTLPFSNNATFTCAPWFPEKVLVPHTDGSEHIYIRDMPVIGNATQTEAYGLRLGMDRSFAILGVLANYVMSLDPTEEGACKQMVMEKIFNSQYSLETRDGSRSTKLQRRRTYTREYYPYHDPATRLTEDHIEIPRVVGDYWFLTMQWCVAMPPNYVNLTFPVPHVVEGVMIIAADVACGVESAIGTPATRVCFTLPTKNILQFGTPKFLPYSLRYPGQTMSSGYINLPTSLIYPLAFDIDLPVDNSGGYMKITYGPSDNLAMYPCDRLTGSTLLYISIYV